MIDGILNIQTVSDTKNRVAVNALFAIGLPTLFNCRDPECDCAVKVLARFRPDVKIVAIHVEVAP